MDLQQDLFKSLDVLFPRFWESDEGELLIYSGVDNFFLPFQIAIKVISHGMGYMELILRIHEDAANVELSAYRLRVDLMRGEAEQLVLLNKKSVFPKSVVKFQKELLPSIHEDLILRLQEFVDIKSKKSVNPGLDDVYNVWCFA